MIGVHPMRCQRFLTIWEIWLVHRKYENHEEQFWQNSSGKNRPYHVGNWLCWLDFWFWPPITGSDHFDDLFTFRSSIWRIFFNFGYRLPPLLASADPTKTAPWHNFFTWPIDVPCFRRWDHDSDWFDGAPTTTATICFLFGLTDGVATSPELVSSTESNCVDAMLRPGKDVLLLWGSDQDWSVYSILRLSYTK